MTCPRCHGLMVVDRRVKCLRLFACMICGNRLDAVIEQHQRETRAIEERRQEQRHWKAILWEEVKELVRRECTSRTT